MHAPEEWVVWCLANPWIFAVVAGSFILIIVLIILVIRKSYGGKSS